MIFLENSQLSLFPIKKPKLPNLNLPLNRLRSFQGHHLNKPSFLKIGPSVPEKIFEKFLPYMEVAAILVM